MNEEEKPSSLNIWSKALHAEGIAAKRSGTILGYKESLCSYKRVNKGWSGRGGEGYEVRTER